MVPLIRSGVLVNLFQSGGDETMESSGSIFNVLEHSQRVGPENHVKGNIQHCPDGVANSYCHDACHKLQMGNGWSLERGIAAFPKHKGTMSLVTMVVAQP